MKLIKCKVCNKKFKRINSFHLNKHDMTEFEYKNKYPNVKMFHDNYINNISIGTKNAMKNSEIRNKLKYKKSKDHRNKLAEAISNKHKNGEYDHIYNENRNNKISIGKKKWWNKQDSKKLLNQWLGKYRGSDKHINMCKQNQMKATRAALGIKQSKPEIAFEDLLIENKIDYIKQYYVGKFPFDFYIPSENKLIEIDGKFYHPLREEDCIYPIQKHNFNRDKIKTKLAIDSGYVLERIRV